MVNVLSKKIILKRIKVGKFIPIRIIGKISYVGEVNYGRLREITHEKHKER